MRSIKPASTGAKEDTPVWAPMASMPIGTLASSRGQPKSGGEHYRITASRTGTSRVAGRRYRDTSSLPIWHQCQEATASSALTRRETPFRGPRLRALMIFTRSSNSCGRAGFLRQQGIGSMDLAIHLLRIAENHHRHMRGDLFKLQHQLIAAHLRHCVIGQHQIDGFRQKERSPPLRWWRKVRGNRSSPA